MPWWAGRLGAGFVTAIFIGAVVTPIFFMRRQNAVREEIGSYAGPANTLTAQIQESLSHELSGIIGFQAKGHRRFADLYNEERTHVASAVNELSTLTGRIGGSAEDRWHDLEAAIAHWHAAVEHEAFLNRLM